MNRVIHYLCLDKIGFLELLFSFFPITLGYWYFGIPGDIFMLLLMDFFALTRKPKIYIPTILKIFFFYVIIHEIIIFYFVAGQPIYMLNAIMTHIVVFVSIPLLSSAINLNRLIGSFNIVAIICIVGIVYHFLLISIGGVCSRIRLPLLYAPPSSRFFQESLRPLSFFFEPQSFCSFMLIPLYFSVMKKKILWASIIILSMFLSTSTTGIILAPVVLLTYAYTQNKKSRVKLYYTLLTVIFIYILSTLSIFEQGVEKLQNTDASTNMRLSSGLEYLKHIDLSYCLLGIPAANPTDFFMMGGVKGANLYLSLNSGSVFLATFWLLLIKFGVIGLLLYLGTLIYPMKIDRRTMLYGIPLMVGMFSNPDFINSAFAVELIILYSQIKTKKLTNRYAYESFDINNAIRK